ncbi:MAG: hypothetical protein WC477_05600 [Patescibacteria group bacterium]
MKNILLVAGVIGLLLATFSGWRSKTVDLLTLLILFWTFLAILWYSKETQELKETAMKRPCVTLYKEGGEIKIKNYGDGVARDIHFDVYPSFTFPLLSSKGFEELPNAIGTVLKDTTDAITINYYDLNRAFKYTTELKWNSDNKDGVQIENYEWKNADSNS